MGLSLESQLYSALISNNLQLVDRLLSANPRPNVNFVLPGEYKDSLLHVAIQCTHPGILRRLLQCPELDLNPGNCRGNSPLNMACWNSRESSVRTLLEDSRTQMPKSTSGAGPLWCAAYVGNVQNVLQLIASDKGLVGDDRVLEMDWDQSLSFSTAEEVARMRGYPRTAKLIAEFVQFPRLARLKARRALGDRAVQAADVFALVVFLSDGYLSLRPGVSSGPVRFLKMMSALPLELQMIISNRSAGSSKEIVLSKDMEPSLAWLACQTF